MFPIRDHNPSERTPYVTYALLAVNAVVFLLMLPLYLSADQNGAGQIFLAYGVIPERVMQGDGYLTLITSMFLHGGFMHFAGNMLFLWIFGDNLEDILGHVKFLIFYLASGLGAAFLQVAADTSSGIPMVGASGAIAGVMGGYLLLFPKARVDVLFIFIIIFKIFPIRAWIMLLLWFGLQLFNGLSSLGGVGGGVAHWAHAGGFIVGFLFVLPVWRRLGGQAFWGKTHGHPDHPEAQYKWSESRVPQVRRRR